MSDPGHRESAQKGGENPTTTVTYPSRHTHTNTPTLTHTNPNTHPHVNSITRYIHHLSISTPPTNIQPTFHHVRTNIQPTFTTTTAKYPRQHQVHQQSISTPPANYHVRENMDNTWLSMSCVLQVLHPRIARSVTHTLPMKASILLTMLISWHSMSGSLRSPISHRFTET